MILRFHEFSSMFLDSLSAEVSIWSPTVASEKASSSSWRWDAITFSYLDVCLAVSVFFRWTCDITPIKKTTKSHRPSFHSCKFLPPCRDNWKALRVELSRLTQDIKGKRTVGQHKLGSIPRLALPNGSACQHRGVWPPHPARIFSIVGTAASLAKLQRHFLMRARCRAETASSLCSVCNYADTYITHISTCPENIQYCLVSWSCSCLFFILREMPLKKTPAHNHVHYPER